MVKIPKSFLNQQILLFLNPEFEIEIDEYKG